MNMMLVACEQGLGTAWVGAFRESDVYDILELPYHLRPVVMVPVGYPSHIPSAPQRVSASEEIKFR
jgi:nitroreductase